jgi:predicted Zn-dependent protease
MIGACRTLERRAAQAAWGTTMGVDARTAGRWTALAVAVALGDVVSESLSPIDERRMGDAIMSEIRPDPAVMDDPILGAYIQSLWKPLLQAAREQGHLSDELAERFAWETFIIRERAVNAFALPGGYVGVYLGLLNITQQRDELASVLAHEMAHVTQRHIARRIVGDTQSTALTIVGTVLGLIAASRAGSVDLAQAAILGSQAAGIQAQLNFSRDMEREADRVGFGVMTAAGYRPLGMVRMFERMEQAMHLTDSGNYPYLRSHPLTTERIGEARQRASLLDDGTAAPNGRLEHALMAARGRVLMDERVDALQTLAGLDAGGREGGDVEQLAARYTAALAAYKLRQRERGDAAVRASQRWWPEGDTDRAFVQRLFTLLQAEGALLAGDGGAGLALLDGLRAAPSERVSLLLRAQLAAQPGVGLAARAEVLERLQTHQVLNPRDSLAWEASARLWELQGQPLRALRAQAESRAALGDTRGAIDRFRSALRQIRATPGGGDPIEVSVIDARLRTLSYQRREYLQSLYPRGVPRDVERD